MKKIIISLLLCMAIAISIAAAANLGTVDAAKEATSLCFAETTGGKVMGYQYDGVDTYFGIQYGTAKRFEMPQPYVWNGLRYCMVYGESAPQSVPTSTKNSFDAMNYSHVKSENEQLCLQLNVWSERTKKNTSRPVIVWLHGGGFSSGSSGEYTFYEGGNLAKDGDVVFVSVNHRLNSLGYLDLSAYDDKYKYSGNAGMADIVLALQWVQDNIGNFGGDPDNVTIIGQSGGGSKVTTLMGMPAASGLFEIGRAHV